MCNWNPHRKWPGDHPHQWQRRQSTGLELSSQYFILPTLSISAAYAWTDAQLTDDAPDLFDPGVGAESGDRLPGTPERKVYLAAHYEMPLRDSSQLEFDWSCRPRAT